MVMLLEGRHIQYFFFKLDSSSLIYVDLFLSITGCTEQANTDPLVQRHSKLFRRNWAFREESAKLGTIIYYYIDHLLRF